MCWRRWKPRQESKRFGREYESWEWSGVESEWAARRLRAELEVKPTRVDIAWDVSVPEYVTADTAWEAIAGHVQRAGLTGGISGQAGINTRYVGSTTSTARVRIYRKDLQDEAWSVQFGRTLRIELVLKGERAEAWWRLFASDPEDAFAAGAGEIQRMTGLAMQQQRQELPQLASSPAANEGQRCVEFLRQYGASLKAWSDAGLPVMDLAADALRQASRNTQNVAKKRTEAIRRAGVEQVIQYVLEALVKPRCRTA
jgi:hypothetical protein